MQQYIGVDLGATEFKIGLVQNAKVLQKVALKVHPSYSEQQLLSVLIKGITQLISPKVISIGIGVPGIVDPDAGIIYDIQNLPDWQEVNLAAQLEQAFKLPVFLNNDANCFAAGQLHYGYGKGHSNFVGLSIGTGLGMGVIIQKQLYNGQLCGAGEIGMLPYKNSILEAYAASFFFSEFYNATAKTLYQLALKDDANALEAFVNFGIHLGQALKIINYTYAPEAIILGGSIANAYTFFKESMLAELATFAYPKQIANLKLYVANGPDLAILGAASLCL